MSEAKHTPGPWRVAEAFRIRGGKGGYVVADYLPTHDQWGDDVLAANARLIAAAPEMLELLQRLAGFAQAYASDSALMAGGRLIIDRARAIAADVHNDGGQS